MADTSASSSRTSTVGPGRWITKPVGMIAIKATDIDRIAVEIAWVISRFVIRSFSIISANYRVRDAMPQPFLRARRPRPRPPELQHLSLRGGGQPPREIYRIQRSEERRVGKE